ncbi:MAG: protein translocase subunit SecD [Ruminococcus sp.]|nr:protein translocase subunit SecD [Ruminococcus sp.]
MKRIGKSTFFIVFALIILFSVSSVFGLDYQYGDNISTWIKGVDDIRLGIDIQGGVDVTFKPSDDYDATDDQLDAATEVIKTRLTSLGINDNEVYSDTKSDRIIVRFPWQAGETDFDPEEAVKELGETAELTFRIGTDTETDPDDEDSVIPSGEIVLNGEDITSATAGSQLNDSGEYEYVVQLTLNDSGTEKFAEATTELAGTDTAISIWMDNTLISAPTVNSAITDGEAIISGSFETYDDAKSLADKISSGALPFKMETSSFKTISPTMGEGSLNAIVLAGIIAFICIAIYMIVLYRLPGAVAVIALIGQIAGSLAVVSGWFGFQNGSTLTIPGIAGIILSVGMGVDANIITGERLKEELRAGKSLDSAVKTAYKKAFSAIFDGNITNVIVAIVLMGAFGVPTSFFSKILNNTIFFAFGATTEGVVYSFGYTLLAGVIFNFIMGVFAARLMVTSLSKFKCFRNRKLYGGDVK